MLSPAYDLLNSYIVLTDSTEEIAPLLKETKSNFNEDITVKYFGVDRLGLNEKGLDIIREEIQSSFFEWIRFIEISFLTDEKRGLFGCFRSTRDIYWLDLTYFI